MCKRIALYAFMLLSSLIGLAQEQNTTKTASAPVAGTQIYYAGGPVMSGPVNVYIVYYGAWTTSSKNIIDHWISHLGGTPLYNVNTTYHDSTGAGVWNAVNYSPSTNSYSDNYSLGTSLTDADVQSIVSNAIAGGHLPADNSGVYFVLTWTDVSDTFSGLSFCGSLGYCGYHNPSSSIVSGDIIKYSFVGNAGRCPSACDGNIANGDTTSPNGDVGADGAISVMFHELSETVSDPEVGITGAWGGGSNPESGDLCAWNFGTWSSLPKASNGAHYNVTISGSNYLIQEMFDVSAPTNPVGGSTYPGSCAIALTSPPSTLPAWWVAVDSLLQ